MAHANRQATADVADRVLAGGRRYNFFGLLELLHHLHGDDLESPDGYDAEHQRVLLASDPGLGFPASDVSRAERTLTGAQHDYRVQATFFGMHGPDSPLPGYYLDRLAYEYGQSIGIRPAFFDFFNHRLLTLLHQAWRKYRYYIRFQAEASDQFSPYVFALVGLGDAQLRGATPISWSRLLSFAGMVASRSRSPSMVAGIIAHCFDLEGVHIREYEFRYTDLDETDLIALGKKNGALGQSFIVGRRVRSRHSKFTIVIPDLPQQRFREFLPSGEDFARLRKLVDFLLRDPIAYDLELGLRVDEVAPFNLRRGAGSQLGWTSFFERKVLRKPPPVRIKVRL
ncbi:type VI secretion system baseplate subunit TssG [Cupriavidus sp. 2TAF22]|uniref:type VI secretion system baseplate subunit TssG n=1 Tax=unclassified Cupriavidus TaxID=2640874 RepID=UPI003F91A61E